MTTCIPSRQNRERGFALLIVLWTLVLIAFLVAQITSSAQTELRIASNLKTNAAAQAAADGAIYQTIFNLSSPQPQRRWPVDGSAHEIQIGSSRITVRLEDEAGKINPSLASQALVAALLQVLGSDPGQAATLAGAIAEWVGAGTPQQSPAVALANYRAAGLDYGPPGAPLESLDELAQVRGMTPQLFDLMRPHLTLFGPPEPDRTVADPVVVAALSITRSGAPAIATGISDLMLVRIHVAAHGPGNALVSRAAIARIGPALPNGYALLAWDSEEN